MIKRSDDMSLPSDRRDFRDRLLARMQEKKITGAELARSANLSKDAISTYTTMRSLPTPKTLARLAKVLECKPAELLPDKPVDLNVLEVREHANPDVKILVVKMTLPALDAVEQLGSLVKLKTRVEKKLAGLLKPTDAS